MNYKEADKLLDDIVEVRYGTGDLKCLARVQGYCDQPTLVLEDEHGRAMNWIADLCKPASIGAAVSYWRERALRAEGKVGAPKDLTDAILRAAQACKP